MDLSIMMQYLYRKKAEKIEQRLAKAEKELTFEMTKNLVSLFGKRTSGNR